MDDHSIFDSLERLGTVFISQHALLYSHQWCSWILVCPYLSQSLLFVVLFFVISILMSVRCVGVLFFITASSFSEVLKLLFYPCELFHQPFHQAFKISPETSCVFWHYDLVLHVLEMADPGVHCLLPLSAPDGRGSWFSQNHFHSIPESLWFGLYILWIKKKDILKLNPIKKQALGLEQWHKCALPTLA